MKIVLTICLICLMGAVQNIQAQSVGIGTTAPHPSAALDVSSSNKGFLPPRMSSSQRTAIPNPKKGLMVYDTTQNEHVYFDGGKWRPFYEKNYDSAVVDYIDSASIPFSMLIAGGTYIYGSAGIIYDNGGPTGNYLPNSDYQVLIDVDDSTLAINVIIEQMNLEIFYDSLFIFQRRQGSNIYEIVEKLSGTQTGSFVFTNDIKILFKSNSINNLAGFKIKWGKVRMRNNAPIVPPLYGWHFDYKKYAAMGGIQRNNTWHTDSVGIGALSYGIDLKAKGNYSISLGKSNKALGEYSSATGVYNDATGKASIAMGYFTKATGDYSIALGQNNLASGYGAFAVGHYNMASGLGAVALGASSRASGDYSTSLGRSTVASGIGAIASGNGSAARSDYSMAMGYQTIAKGFASTVIGLYNDSLLLTNINAFLSGVPLFIIGNGDNETRSNAMVVYKNGNTVLNGNLKINNGNAAVGKVLMATDGLGNSDWINLSTTATGFAANRTTTLSVAPSTFTDVLFTTQSVDDGGDNYDPATGEFTAPTAGMYRFEASVYWNAGITGFENIYFYVNGATRRFHSIVSTNTSSHTLPFTASFKLNAGDVVKVVAYHTNATAVGISANANGTYFTGVKVY